MSDQDEMALNQNLGEETQLDATPAIEEQTPEEVTPVEEQSEPTGEESPETKATETEGEPKKGSQARIRELVKERNDLRARVQDLTQPSQKAPQFDLPPLEPGAEVSPEQYRAHVMQQADALVSLRLKQSEAINRINSETQEVLQTYPQLDPESEDFNKDLSDSITEAALAYVKANPYSASVKQFVTKLMKPYQGAVTKEVGQVRATLAKQVTQTALRPTSVSKPEKTVDEMSIAELEAKLGVVQA